MKQFLISFYQAFLHVIFPRVCLACGQDLPYNTTQFLCAGCTQNLKIPAPLICQRCGVVLKSGGAHCFACRGSKAKAYKCSLIRSAYIFNTSSRALVHALKYQGADFVAAQMGQLMADRFAVLPEFPSVDLVLPVPLHPLRRKKRGYNQSELLARTFANASLLAFEPKVLVRTRDTQSQTKLGRTARLENMNGAFLCVRPECVRRKTILLIDDVATTGATLEGCARALKAAGAKKVVAYTFAREN